jgi:hypothetical protein
MVDVMERQTWVDNICKGVRDEINKRRNEHKKIHEPKVIGRKPIRCF